MGEDMKSYVFLFLIGLFSTFLVRFITSKKRIRMPPGPKGLPIIGHFHLLGTHPHQSLYELSKRFGPLIHLRLGSIPLIVASSPDMAREFFKTQDQFFSDRAMTKVADYLSYGSKNFSFAPYGPYWKFIKKLTMTELLGARALEQFQPFRREEILRLLRGLRHKSEMGEPVNMTREFQRLTNNVVTNMAISKKCSGSEEEAEETSEIVDEMMEILGKFNLADFIGFLKNWDLHGLEKRQEEVRLRFDRMIEAVIKEKEESRMRRRKIDETGIKDVLDKLLDISEDENAEFKIGRENIKAFIMDMFTAGTDTSALTTDWVFAELINNPKVLKKAREEIDSVVGRARLVEESDTVNLPYLQAIVKETMRLHPAGPLIHRLSTADCKVNGYDIPANSRLMVNAWAIGRDPAYGEDPLEFRPERFMEDGLRAINVRGQHFQLLPFGSGRRACPGVSLTLQLMHLTIASVVQCFEWKVEGTGVVDMTEGVSLINRRAQPMVCIPIAITSSSTLY